MKEYEIVAKFYNACAGSSRPQTFFEESELGSTDDYVRMKHSRDFEKFKKEILPDGRIVYSYDNGSVTYIYRYAMENGYQVAGFHRECYIDGIWNKENVEDWLTEIQLPVK